MNKVKKVFWNLVIFLALLILFCLVSTKITTGWSSIGSYRLFFIMSESMDPEIKKHDIVIGKTIRDRDLEVGNIYAYRTQGILGQKIIIHRLIGITEDGRFLFKGDNNDRSDKFPVKRENIGYEIYVKK